MKTKAQIRGILSGLALCACLLSNGQVGTFPGMDSLIEAEMNKWNVPGLAVGIIHKGTLVYAKGFGVKEIGKNDPVDENTLFAVGSNTKAFTGTMMSMLELQGKLSLSDKVRKYLPDFRLMDSTADAACNLTDILCHRVGFQTFAGDFVAWGSHLTTTQLIHRLRYLKPTYDFRTRYGYFNMGFVTAGEVMRQVTGKEWHSLVKEMILEPLGMKRTFPSTKDIFSDKNVAIPHTYNDKGEIIPIPYRNIDNIAACGSLNSCVTDMAKWLIYQLDTANTPIPRQAIWNTWKAQTLLFTGLPNAMTPGAQHFGNYSLGWFLNDYYGKLLISHSGGVDGMLSRCGFMPEAGFGVVVLTNYDDQDLFECLFYKILDAYFEVNLMDHCRKSWEQYSYFKEKRDGKWEKIRKRIQPSLKIPASVRNQLAGKYHHPHYGEAEIIFDKVNISLRFSGHPGLIGSLSWLGDNEFLILFNDPMYKWAVLPINMKGSSLTGFTLDLPDFLEMGDYEFMKK